MRALTTIAAAAALSLGVASASQAAVFAQFSPDTNAQDYNWVKTGNTTGTFTALGGDAIAGQGACTTCAAIHFSFLDPALSDIAFVPAQLTINSAVNSPGAAATVNGAGVWTQTNLDGGFHITYYDHTKAVGSTQTFGSFTLTNGVSNLLSGVFTGAWIQGAGGDPSAHPNPGGSGSTNVTIGNGGVLTYTSDFEHLPGLVPGSEAFALNLLNALPQFHASPGRALDSFNANGGGNFSVAQVPEPATWGLMIMGFGGLGMVLRSRRRGAPAQA